MTEFAACAGEKTLHPPSDREPGAAVRGAGEKTLHPTSDRVPGAVLWDASFDARRRPPIGLEDSCPRPVEL